MADVPISDKKLLHEWQPRLGRLSVGEKIEQAQLLKRQGNLWVTQDNFKHALTSYAKVFAYVNGLSVAGDTMSQYTQGDAGITATKEEHAHIQSVKVAVWANMALCYVKGGTQPDKALSCCDKVLELEPQHSKARFRQAQALMQLRHFERASKVLSDLLDEEPKNATVRREIRVLQAQKRVYDAKAKAKDKRAFSKIFE